MQFQIPADVLSNALLTKIMKNLLPPH